MAIKVMSEYIPNIEAEKNYSKRSGLHFYYSNIVMVADFLGGFIYT